MNSFSARRVALFVILLSGMALAGLAFALDAPAADNLACANAPVAADPTSTVCVSGMVVVFNGESPDNQFYVSWRTVKNETGQVKLATGETYDDVRGGDFQGKTHYIAVYNLKAKTTYTFDVISGGKTYTNNNAHWSLRQGPPIESDNPYTVLGRVSNPDGTDADGTIVYAQLRDANDQGSQGRSAWLSALVVVSDGGNYFNINVDAARTANNVQKYAYTPDGDRVFILAVGPQGKASQAFKISDLHPPLPAPSLILSSTGMGSAVTATPTLIMPSSTPTVSITPTATATPVSPTPTETQTVMPASPTTELAMDTPEADVTDDSTVPTEEAVEATRIAEEPQTTTIAKPAGVEAEPQSTRIYAGVPTVIPPEQNNNNSTLLILAIVLIVGAVLLGLAAFFITRKT